jgi:hypothetical protein
LFLRIGMGSAELKHKTFQSVIWAVVRIGASNVLSFIVFMVLARLLSPHDFGVFALATLVADIARVISTAGLNDAVTRICRRGPRRYRVLGQSCSGVRHRHNGVVSRAALRVVH